MPFPSGSLPGEMPRITKQYKAFLHTIESRRQQIYEQLTFEFQTAAELAKKSGLAIHVVTSSTEALERKYPNVEVGSRWITKYSRLVTTYRKKPEEQAS